MENASKALLMAGGVLISVLIISALLLAYTQMTSLSNSKGQILKAEQLAEYNKQWESYNRDNLRGADVISIINKALDTNEKYKNLMDDDNFTMINIYIRITESFGESTEKWKFDTKTNKYVRDGQIQYNITLNARAKPYDLSNEADKKTIEKFIKKVNESTSEYRTNPPNPKPGENYERIYNEFASFKLMTEFSRDTEGFVYDEYGRITEIHLKQTSLKK